MATGVTHTFFGITTSRVALFTVAATGIGLSYLASGILMLAMKKRAATVALVLLSVDIVGRILLAVTGLYPTDTAKNTDSLIAGTLIVAFVALYGMEAEVLRLSGSGFCAVGDDGGVLGAASRCREWAQM